MPKKRFRIGPGGVMYAIVVALIFAMAHYTQANLLYWGFGLMVGGLTISVLLSFVMMRGLTVQRILPSHGVAGEAMVLRYQIVNRKRWMPVFGLVIHETWGKGLHGYRRTGPAAKPRGKSGGPAAKLAGRPFGWVLHLGAGQTAQAEAPCWPGRRGYLDFQKIVLSTSFPFGVVRRIAIYDLPGRVLIYPHLWRIDRKLLYKLASVDPYGRKQLNRPGGHEEFFGMRQYRAGDSLKMIDWKRSARTGQLITREMTQPSPPRLMIALDLTQSDPPHPESVVESAPHKSPPPNNGNGQRGAGAKSDDHPALADLTESAVSLAASLICDAHFHSYQIGLIVLGAACTRYPIHHSLPHRTKMLESLSLLDTESPYDPSGQLPAQPMVVVGLNGSDTPHMGARVTFLSAQCLDEYLSAVQVGSTAILGRPGQIESRRRQLRSSEAWT